MFRIQNWKQALCLMALGSVFTIIVITFSPVKVRAKPVEQGKTAQQFGKPLEESPKKWGDEEWLDQYLTTPEGKAAYEETAKDFPFLTMTFDEWTEKTPEGREFWKSVTGRKITHEQARAFIADVSEYGLTEAQKRRGYFLGGLRRMATNLMEAGRGINYRLQSGQVREDVAVDQRVEPPRYFDGLFKIVHGTYDLTDILRLLFFPCLLVFILTKRNWLKWVTMGIWLLTIFMDSPNFIFHIIVTAVVALLVYFARWIVRLVKRGTKQPNDTT